MDFRFETHDSLPSSNTVVKHAIEAGEPEGLVVHTFQQTAGYGRLGRSWVSPFGGLYFSVLLRPQVALAQLPTLGIVTALAQHRAIAAVLPSSVRSCLQLKWPNDVVWEAGACEAGTQGVDGTRDAGAQAEGAALFAKVSGTSLERHAGGTCVGIGVNVFQPFGAPEVTGKNRPVYLARFLEERLQAAGVSVQVAEGGPTGQQRAIVVRLRDEILAQFQQLYDLWQHDGPEPLLDEYTSHLALAGRQVSVVDQLEQQTFTGVVEGVDAQGRLLLRTGVGSVQAVSAGEVRLR